MSEENHDVYVTYLARGGKLHQEDLVELRRRTTKTGRIYNSYELKGLERAYEIAREFGVSINERIAAAYHHLQTAFSGHFSAESARNLDEKRILREAVAMEGDLSSVAKLH